jgi:hypothetical protein
MAFKGMLVIRFTVIAAAGHAGRSEDAKHIQPPH